MGTEVAKQAGVTKTAINGGVAIDYITKTDGGKGPQPGDVSTPSWVDLDASSTANTLIAPVKGTKIATTDKSASTKSATTKSSNKDTTKATTDKATKTTKSAGE